MLSLKFDQLVGIIENIQKGSEWRAIFAFVPPLREFVLEK